MTRESAARFSFLLSLPIIGGAALLKSAQLAKDGMPAGMAWPFLWGMLASGVSGYLVIAWLLRYLKTKDFLPFMIYRLVGRGHPHRGRHRLPSVGSVAGPRGADGL